MAERKVFKNNGDRPNVPDLLILMTDGEPTIEIKQLPDRVNQVKKDGIRIIGIGVSKGVSVRDYVTLTEIQYSRKFTCMHFSILRPTSYVSCQVDEALMKRTVSPPDTKNYFKVTNFKELDDILHRLLRDVVKNCITPGVAPPKGITPIPAPAPIPAPVPTPAPPGKYHEY